MTEVERFAVWLKQTSWHEWWPWIVLAVGIAFVTVGGRIYDQHPRTGGDEGAGELCITMDETGERAER